MAGANFYIIGGNDRPRDGDPVPAKTDKVKSLFLIFATAMILVAGTFLATLILPMEWDRVFLLMAGLLIILTIIVHQINSVALSSEGRSVIISYLIATILKLVLGSVMLIVLLKYNRGIALEIVITFLVYYSAFTTLEIIMVNKRLRAEKL